jgi:tetratricopeptide (TPR) repeat protein
MRTFLVPAALVTVLAVAFQVVVTRRTHQGWRQLNAGMHADAQRGGLHGLLRARSVGMRVGVAEPEDPDTAASLAWVSARLAAGYGLSSDREAEAAAARAERAGVRSGVLAAARALVELYRGQREQALATAAAATSGGTAVEPYLALACARAWSGELVAASRALEAARVIGPEGRDARVLWAELRIDLGDPAAAVEALEPLVRDEPEDTEALLLMAEGLDGLGRAQAPSPALAAGCQRDQEASPTLRAGCALERASRARLAGDPRRALAQGHAASGIEPPQPRLLARIAQLLGQLGSVDQAALLLTAARRRGADAMPAMAWARLAVALGRGQPATLPSVPATGSVPRVLALRAAFASGGARALEEWPTDPLGDPEVRLYLAAARGAPLDTRGPLADYLLGLRARLAGDLQLASIKLYGALSGHGDACRAAGEYVATVRALGREVDLLALEPLRTSNAQCTHLSPAALARPIERPARKR